MPLHDDLNEKQVNAYRTEWKRLSSTASPRFAAYADPADRDGFDPLARYLWNLAIGEALIPILNGAELMLRNVIHNAMMDATGNPAWFSAAGFLRNAEGELLSRAVRDATNKLHRKGNEYSTPSPNEIVTELPFKFWTGMLGPAYEASVWKMLLRHRLGNLPLEWRNRDHFRGRCNAIREFRNRIAHHEPIFRRSETPEIHATARDLVKNISAPYDRLLNVLDRFKEVYQAGDEHYRLMLLQSHGHDPARALNVSAAEDKHTLVGASMEECAAVFDCGDMARWVARLVNTHPTRRAEMQRWQSWLEERTKSITTEPLPGQAFLRSQVPETSTKPSLSGP